MSGNASPSPATRDKTCICGGPGNPASLPHVHPNDSGRSWGLQMLRDASRQAGKTLQAQPSPQEPSSKRQTPTLTHASSPPESQVTLPPTLGVVLKWVAGRTVQNASAVQRFPHLTASPPRPSGPNLESYSSKCQGRSPTPHGVLNDLQVNRIEWTSGPDLGHPDLPRSPEAHLLQPPRRVARTWGAAGQDPGPRHPARRRLDPTEVGRRRAGHGGRSHRHWPIKFPSALERAGEGLGLGRPEGSVTLRP